MVKNMQQKINKFIWILVPILLIAVLLLYYNSKKEENVYTSNFFYMDTYIYIKLYDLDSKTAQKVFKEIETIYQEYHQLADRYQTYDNITNIYTIHNNQEDSSTLTLDERLYRMIAYGKEWYNKSNGKIDISMGNVIDIWKQYRNANEGIPTIQELQTSKTDSINDIVLLDNFQIENNHVNIDLGALAKGYATEEVGTYLESIGIEHYVINAGGNVKVGTPYKKEKFSIGIEDPNSEVGEVYKIVYGSNISVVTSGGYERYYEYDGKKYHHIIDPETLMPSEYMKSVTIITPNSSLGDVLSTTLFLMPIEEGKQLIEELENVEAIWYTNEDTIVTSSGMDLYEQK